MNKSSGRPRAPRIINVSDGHYTNDWRKITGRLYNDASRICNVNCGHISSSDSQIQFVRLPRPVIPHIHHQDLSLSPLYRQSATHTFHLSRQQPDRRERFLNRARAMFINFALEFIIKTGTINFNFCVVSPGAISTEMHAHTPRCCWPVRDVMCWTEAISWTMLSC